MADTLIEIQPLHSATATEPSTQPFVTMPYSLLARAQVRVQFWDALQASGTGTWQFSALISYNKGQSWPTTISGAVITLTAAGQTGEQTLVLTPDQPDDSGTIWIQVIATLGGASVSPVISYRADLQNL